MSILSQQVQIKEFAFQCFTALNKVKEALPEKWQESLLPYQEKIRAVALEKNTTIAKALDQMLLQTMKEHGSREKVKTIQLYLMAAFCDMSQK